MITEQERELLIDKATNDLNADELSGVIAGMMGQLACRALKEGGQAKKAEIFDTFTQLCAKHNIDAYMKSQREAHPPLRVPA